MSWTDIAPQLAGKAATNHLPVVFGVGAPLGARAGRPMIVTLVIRSSIIEDCPKFLTIGQSVRVMEGNGEQEGMLQIVPGNGQFRFSVAGGPKHGVDKSLLMLRFPLPKLVEPAKFRSVAEFDYGADWLQVTIPVGARRAKAAPKAPFVSAIADVPHTVRRARP